MFIRRDREEVKRVNILGKSLCLMLHSVLPSLPMGYRNYKGTLTKEQSTILWSFELTESPQPALSQVIGLFKRCLQSAYQIERTYHWKQGKMS